jgi:DNA-binding Lrp family transcriptional regulator
MDEIDGKILRELQEDGKAKLKKIAKKAGVPMSTAHHRIIRMEQDGVIRKYSAIPDFRKIGLPVCAYVFVTVDHANLRSQEEIAKELRKIPNVLEANIVSGELDIIVKARVKDVEDLGQTVVGKMRGIKGISKTVTSVVLKETE